jgi:hypothetical protein
MRGFVEEERRRMGDWWTEVRFNASGASERFIAAGAISELCCCRGVDHVLDR